MARWADLSSPTESDDTAADMLEIVKAWEAEHSAPGRPASSPTPRGRKHVHGRQQKCRSVGGPVPIKDAARHDARSLSSSGEEETKGSTRAPSLSSPSDVDGDGDQPAGPVGLRSDAVALSVAQVLDLAACQSPATTFFDSSWPSAAGVPQVLAVSVPPVTMPLPGAPMLMAPMGFGAHAPWSPQLVPAPVCIGVALPVAGPPPGQLPAAAVPTKMPAQVAPSAVAISPTPAQAGGSGSALITCTYEKGGIVRAQWDADLRKLASQATCMVSPAFSLDLPGLGKEQFKFLVHASSARGCKGFRSVQGRGRIELKCDASFTNAGEEYSIVLDKGESAKLGIDLASQDGRPWRITAINPGLVEQWNWLNGSRQVRMGDRIVEANGVRAPVAQVRGECSKPGVLRLTLRRGEDRASPCFHVRFNVGSGATLQQPRGPICHDFSKQGCCGLHRDDAEWDLASAANTAARKVSICVELVPACSGKPPMRG